MKQPPDKSPRHTPSSRCPTGACVHCSPHAELRDLLDGLERCWRARLFAVLVEAGYTSPALVAAAGDDELRALYRLGKGALRLLRERAAARHRAPTPAERLAAGIRDELSRHLGGGALP